MKISPLLEQRRNTARQQSGNLPSTQIHVHLSDYTTPSTSTPSQQPAVPLQTPSMNKSTKLVQGVCGTNLGIDIFCAQYELSKAIASRLQENGYMKTRTLRHITIEELVVMGFKPGEVASLQDAVEDWTPMD